MGVCYSSVSSWEAQRLSEIQHGEQMGQSPKASLLRPPSKRQGLACVACRIQQLDLEQGMEHSAACCYRFLQILLVDCSLILRPVA